MLARTLFTLTAALLLATPATAVAHERVPEGFRSFNAYQVVEQIMVHREVLNLSQEQFDRLDAISRAVRTEKHQFVHRGGKPHRTRHVTMISRGQVFEQAMAVLTTEQQERVQGLFQAPLPKARVERRVTRPHGKP